jgi:hypothetical protein
MRIWITIPIPDLQTKRYQDPIQIRKSAYIRITRREKATWAWKQQITWAWQDSRSIGYYYYLKCLLGLKTQLTLFFVAHHSKRTNLICTVLVNIIRSSSQVN